MGIAHFTTIDVEPLAFVQMAASIGYATVGLRLWPAFPNAPYYRIPVGSALMRSMRSRLADTGLSVWDIEFVVIDAAFDVEQAKPMLESAAELGARRVSVCGDDPDHSRLAAKFSRLCDLGAEVGMGVDLEIMPWRQVNSVQTALGIIHAANRPNAALLVDALHLARSGGDPAVLRNIPATVIRSAQLCDAAAERPATTQALIEEARRGRLMPGAGRLPLNRLLAELPDHVVLSVEVPNAGHPPEDHARRVFTAARNLLSSFALRETV